MRLASAVLLVSLLGSAANADPPLARPDYLFDLPDRQWAFAEKLWEERQPCTAHLCEAGYHDGDFVMSVVRGMNYFQGVAGLKGCSATSQQIIPADHPEALPPEQRRKIVTDLATGLAAFAHEACKVPNAAISTEPLSAL